MRKTGAIAWKVIETIENCTLEGGTEKFCVSGGNEKCIIADPPKKGGKPIIQGKLLVCISDGKACCYQVPRGARIHRKRKKR